MKIAGTITARYVQPGDDVVLVTLELDSGDVLEIPFLASAWPKYADSLMPGASFHADFTGEPTYVWGRLPRIPQ